MTDETRMPVIVGALRTPVGRAHGRLASLDVADLLVPLIRRLVAEAGLAPDAIDDIVVGNAAASSGNIARLAGLSAGLPHAVPGLTVDRQCGSGLEAIILACRLVEAGAGEVYLAGGVESVSTAPWRVERPKQPGALPRFFARARFSPDAIGDPEMGIAAENVAARCGIGRPRQDAFALRSHQRAIRAHEEGRFAREIVPVATPDGVVDADECPRSDTSPDKLARLKPAFRPDGTVTAGNCCPLNDGAALVLVTSAAWARRLGAPRRLDFVDAAAAGVDPNLLGLGPVPSTRKLQHRLGGLDLDTVDLVEFNEAFASQVLASLDALGIAEERVNREGGAIALGHPFGASGAILVTRLFSQMTDPSGPGGVRSLGGLAMLGIGGGLGLTAYFRSHPA
ncbi:thiolase family protein [uncultured Methylobacterium sp.]|uniref:thiolase family protein n=1 Tax=uncultured Methylobacterium sp. TaxID=157278 RepID=UPI00259A7986|nr:thiolase family protein [uncultured Methylobacterium sp.]